MTIISRRHLLLWTVEWIDAEGTKDISDSCQENSTIVELYALKQTEVMNAIKRKPGEHRREASKRRRIAKQIEAQEESNCAVAKPEATVEPHDGAASTSAVTDGDEKDEPSAKTDDKATAGSTQPDLEPQDNTTNVPEVETEVDASLHFYLLKPGTSSKEKVLIALNRKATLTSCLQDQTVLEFPTIFVLPHEPTSLPAEYMLEKQYLQLQKTEKEELKEAVMRAEKTGSCEHARSAEASAKSGVPVDANSILNVLRRDMTR